MSSGTGAGLFGLVEGDMAQVDAVLGRVVRDENPLVSGVADYLRAAVGKRIRPALVLLSARAAGVGDPQIPQVVPIAAAVEMIHMATLVHDDIIDDAAVRRGRAALRVAFNDHVAVLAGDFLFARAFQLLADTGMPTVVRTAADVVHAICVGEIRQNLDQGRTATEAEYLARIEGKTAAFVSASCRLGALAAEADDEVLDSLTRFGWHVGMAFQMVDDLLDLTADPERLGKAVASDYRQGVVTLPVIYAVQHTREAGRFQKALAYPEEPGAARVIHETLEESGALRYVKQQADDMLKQALALLQGVPPSTERDALRAVAQFVVSRDF